MIGKYLCGLDVLGQPLSDRRPKIRLSSICASNLLWSNPNLPLQRRPGQICHRHIHRS